MTNKDTIQVILMPRGYGKTTKEVRDYITNLQEEIERQEKAQIILDNQNAELQERINNAIEYMIKQRDVITDYVHQAKEINEDYLFLDRTSLETFKNIYEILKGEDNEK